MKSLLPCPSLTILGALLGMLPVNVPSQDSPKNTATAAQVLELEMAIEFEAGLGPGPSNFTDNGTLIIVFDVTNRNRLRLDGRPVIRRSTDDSGAVKGVAKEDCRYVVTPSSATYTTFSLSGSDYVFVNDKPDAVWANDMAIMMGLSLHPGSFQAMKALSAADPAARFSETIRKIHGAQLPKGETLVKNPNDPTHTLKLVIDPKGSFTEVTETFSDKTWQSYAVVAA